VKDVGRNDLATLIDSSQEVAKKSLEKATECVRCLEEDMAKARERVELQEFSLGSCPPSMGLQGMRWSTIGDQRVLKLGLDWDTNEMSILMLTKPLNGPVFLLVWKIFLLTPWLRPWWKKLFTLPTIDLRKKAVGGIIASQRTESSLAFLRSPARRLQKANFSEFIRFYDFVFFMCRENGQKNI
ncbi:hypothetical protein S83_028787, partial [Arachis hypogaea]